MDANHRPDERIRIVRIHATLLPTLATQVKGLFVHKWCFDSPLD